MKKKRCKECGEFYRLGKGANNEHRKHQHGKNHAMYGRRGVNSPMHYRTGSKNHMFGRTGKLAPMYGRTGRKHPSYGKTHSSKAKAKMSKANKAKWKRGVYNKVRLGTSKSGYREDLGHFVRSTWEANFARVLNYLEVKYQYEPKRFQTPYGSYCPDFYIPKWKTFVEIKGYETNSYKQPDKIKYLKKNGVKLCVVRINKYLHIIKLVKNKILLEE